METSWLNMLHKTLPVFILLVLATILWRLLGTWFRRREKKYGRQAAFSRQLTRVFFTISLVTGLIATFPVSGEIRGQLLGFWGILISAALALSSTTFLGNLLAGFMLKTIGNFSVGDFIRANDYFGRVSELGIFHVEVQIEESQLVALPNLLVATKGVEVFPDTGILISTTVSLGYDLHRLQVEPALIEAALNAGLEEAFVRIIELGNHAVTYRLSGLLREVKTIISSRSRLNACVLDSLHGKGMEILSPDFMNQRRKSGNQPVIPPMPEQQMAKGTGIPETQEPEQLIFAKAEAAEKIETLVEGMDKLKERIESGKEEKKRLKDPEREDMDKRIQRLESWLQMLQDKLDEKRREMDSH